MDYYPMLLVLLIPLTIILHYLTQKHSKLPPGPKPWPIIGNLHQLGSKPHHSIANLSKIYGPIMSLKLGSITTIVISSYEVAKETFLRHDLAVSSRHVLDGSRAADHAEHSIGWLPVGPKWRALRKAVATQVLTTTRLDATRGVRREKVGGLVEYVRKCREGGKAVDVGKAVFAAALNVLSTTFFSVDLAGYDPSDVRELPELLLRFSEEAGKPNVSDAFPFLRRLDLQGRRREIERCFSMLLRFVGRIVDERVEMVSKGGDDGKDDVLRNLLMLVERNELSLKDVKHLLIDMLIAGADTTSTLLEWAMTELLRHPGKMARAQAEIDEFIGVDEMVEESSISKLPYTQAIVKETLRLHPPAPFLLPRKAERDVQVLGHIVPKGALVLVNAWWIGRDPRVWADPDSFAPERFLERERDVEGRDFESLPFGGGRRMCPGTPLAYRMAHLVLANLIHSFHWKPSDCVSPQDVDVEDKFGVVLQRLRPLHAIPVYTSR